MTREFPGCWEGLSGGRGLGHSAGHRQGHGCLGSRDMRHDSTAPADSQQKGDNLIKQKSGGP